MKKMSVTTTLALLFVLILGSAVAYAGFNWDGDPEFDVEGTIVNVTVSPDEYLDFTTVRVTLKVPKGVEAELTPEGNPDNFIVEIIEKGKAKKDKIPVEVTVWAPKEKPDLKFTVTVDVSGGKSKSRQGKTGKNIKVKVDIRK